MADRIAQLVLEHRVCWDVDPLYSVALGSSRLQVGFELILAGVSQESATLVPGGPEVDGVHAVLREVAEAVMPPDGSETDHAIESFLHGVQQSPKREYRDEVRLCIQLTHHTGYQRPVDADEIACLRGMEQRLHALGAHKGHWPKS